MAGFNLVQNSGKWLDFSVINNLKTLIFATRESLILLNVSYECLYTSPLWGGKSEVNLLSFAMSGVLSRLIVTPFTDLTTGNVLSSNNFCSL